MEERTHTMSDKATASPAAQLDTDALPPIIMRQTLAAWRAALANLRTEERQKSQAIPAETGRLLEIVGQVLAQGDGSLPPDDVARIEDVTRIAAKYREMDEPN